MMRHVHAVATALLAMEAAFGASLTLPVAEVKGAVDNQAKTFPAKVVAMQRVDLAPEVSGEILEVCCADGALVKAGDVLFRLNPIKYKSNLKNAQAKVAECKSRKLYADSNFARHEKTKGVSQDAVDKARSDRDVAASALEAAEAELAVAEYNLSHCEVKAPITGKVGTVRLTKGNYASPEKGALVTITQITPIRVRFSISSADFLTMFQGRSKNLKEKAAVDVILADGSTFGEKGEIDYTENIADESTDTLRVYARFANAERVLRPGRGDAGRAGPLRVGAGRLRQGRETVHRTRADDGRSALRHARAGHGRACGDGWYAQGRPGRRGDAGAVTEKAT